MHLNSKFKLVQKLISFWYIPRQEKSMFVCNFILCFAAKIAIKCMTYSKLAVYFGKSYKMLIASCLITAKQKQEILAIRRSIKLTLRFIPMECNCLVQALVACFWCKRYKIPYLFFIGLDKKHSKFTEAHAWVMAREIPITGGNCLETHYILCTYSNLETATKVF